MSSDLIILILVISLALFILFLFIRHSKKKIGPSKFPPVINSVPKTSTTSQTVSAPNDNIINTEVKNTSFLNIIFFIFGLLSIIIGAFLSLTVLLTLPGVIMVIAGFIFLALGELVHNAQLQTKILQRILNNSDKPNQ